MLKKDSKSNCFGGPKRFFAYYKAEEWGQIGRQRVKYQELVKEWGGMIADDAADVGPGNVVDMPGYKRFYEVLEMPTVDAFVTDLSAFGLR